MTAWCTERSSVRRSDSAAVRSATTARSAFDDRSLSYCARVTAAGVDIPRARAPAERGILPGSARVNAPSCDI